MRKIGILGSTGSIGTQTLEIVRKEKDMGDERYGIQKSENETIEYPACGNFVV